MTEERLVVETMQSVRRSSQEVGVLALGDAVTPAEAIAAAVEAGVKKAQLSIGEMVIRGALSGALLGAATLLSVSVWAQGLPRITGALVFPVGFCMLVLLGLELATGNFALLPMAWFSGRLPGAAVVRNWWWVYLGNVLGGLGFALLATASLTGWWQHDAGPIGEQLRLVAIAKVTSSASAGWMGWLTVATKGVLANWLVTVGTILAFSARSTGGKIVAMWLPILTFFALAYEHSIVNAFVVPAGILVGAPVGVAQWIVWNQVPATVGNIVGGGVLTGLALLRAHG